MRHSVQQALRECFVELRVPPIAISLHSAALAPHRPTMRQALPLEGLVDAYLQARRVSARFPPHKGPAASEAARGAKEPSPAAAAAARDSVPIAWKGPIRKPRRGAPGRPVVVRHGRGPLGGAGAQAMTLGAVLRRGAPSRRPIEDMERWSALAHDRHRASARREEIDELSGAPPAALPGAAPAQWREIGRTSRV